VWRFREIVSQSGPLSYISRQDINKCFLIHLLISSKIRSSRSGVRQVDLFIGSLHSALSGFGNIYLFLMLVIVGEKS
jgi:hypothetical protein